MTTITIPGFIHCEPSKWGGPDVVDGRRYTWFSCEDMSTYGYIMVMPYTLNITPPEGWNPASAEIVMLRAKRAEVTAKFQAMVTEIDRQINERLALEMTQ